VLRTAARLRLTEDERDELLLAAGFAPEARPQSETAPHADAVAGSGVPSPAGAAGGESPIPAPRRDASPHIARQVLLVAPLVLLLVGVTVWWLDRSGLMPYRRYPQATAGETLILVAHFANYTGGQQGYNVAGRLQTALEREITAGRIPDLRAAIWPEELRDEAAAQGALARAGAAVIIWGEYDSGRVLARFGLAHQSGPVRQSEPGRRLEQRLASPGDLPATINGTLPEEVRHVALLTLAQVDIERRAFDRARATLIQARARPLADADAAAILDFYLGYAYQEGDPADLDQAIRYYSGAIEKQRDMFAARNNRAIASLRRGLAADLDRAAEDLSHVLSVAPDDAAAANNRAAVYLRRNSPGDLEAALLDLERAIKLAPEAPEGYYNRALAYVRLNERERWEADFRRLLDRDPEHVAALSGLCWAHALDRRPEQALPYCDAAVRLDATAASYDSRGIAYAELGRLEDAARDIERFVGWAEQEPLQSPYRAQVAERQAWLEALRAGRNPFDLETLEGLRQE
jgi:tetratricopeptide (TPR) repeat protein